MTYLHLNVNITCIECHQQNGWKENFLQNGLRCMRPFYAYCFRGTFSRTTWKWNIISMTYKVITSSYDYIILILRLEQKEPKWYISGKINPFYNLLLDRSLGRYIRIQTQQVYKMQDTSIHCERYIKVKAPWFQKRTISFILGMIKLYNGNQNLNYISTEYHNDLCITLNYLMRCQIVFPFKYSRLVFNLFSRSLCYVACIEK